MYVKDYLRSGMMMETSCFCRAMILSGCSFESVVEVYYGGQGQLGSENADSSNYLDLLELYNAGSLMYYLVMTHAPEFVYPEEHQQVGNPSAHLGHTLDH